jgi:transmembrane sensor
MKRKEEIHKLLNKFFAGEISDNEMNLLKSWLEQDRENRRIFDIENEIWQDASIYTKFENFKTDAAWLNISSKLGFNKNDKSVSLLNRKILRILIAAASISVLLFLGEVSYRIVDKSSIRQISSASTMITTNDGERATICLSDSSKIILNSKSTLKYDGSYNLKDRTVNLAGEAFFDISTNPKKPFIVQLNQMSITATGTRFNVFSFLDEDRVETTLEEGAINVSIKGMEPIKVKEGQQVVYFMRSKKVLVRDVSPETYTSWKENKLRFINTPLEEVLRRIGRKYNVKFEIPNNPDLLSLKYTATFIDESIEEVMQMLKTVSPITYKIYNRTTVNDKQYIKPRIVVSTRRK